MKKILVILLVAFVLIQFFPIDKNNPAPTPQLDFLTIKNTPESTAKLIRTGCYDCHSNEVKYPSYAYIAPISWSIKHHVNEGKENVNFSEWMTYNKDQKEHILDEVIETIERKEMPFKGYIPMHPEANLTDAQRKILIDYFKGLQKSGQF